MKDINLVELFLPGFVCSKPSDIIVHNFYLNSFEADMLRITDSGALYEFEIKMSRSDFFNDFKKKRYGKHKHEELKEGNLTPNYFCFVCPKGMIKKEEVPDYAGLIEFERRINNHNVLYLNFYHVKKAKRLHKRKFEDYRKIAHVIAWRDNSNRKVSILNLHEKILARKNN